MPDFRQLLEEQLPRLRRYARALTHSADRADDLVHDTVLRALAKEHLWQPGTDLRAWLFTLMHNQNINNVRRAVREGTVIDVDAVFTSLVATTDPTASRQLYELDRGLARLSEDHRRVVLLVGLEGIAYEDAAAILGVPVGTVRSRLSRGRQNLREMLDRPEESGAETPPAARAA